MFAESWRGQYQIQAMNLVAKRWGEVQAVAAALLERGKLRRRAAIKALKEDAHISAKEGFRLAAEGFRKSKAADEAPEAERIHVCRGRRAADREEASALDPTPG